MAELFDYAEMQAAAQELIDAAGRTVTFEKLSATPTDSDRPWRGSAVPTVASFKDAKVAFVPLSSYRDLGSVTVNESLLQGVNMVGLVAGDDTFDFSRCHSITDGGVRYGIEIIDALKPGDTALLYYFKVKQ